MRVSSGREAGRGIVFVSGWESSPLQSEDLS